MDTLFSRYRNVILLVAVLFIQLVMLAFQIKKEQDVPLIREWVVNTVTPIEKVFSGSVRGVVGVWHNYVDLRRARQENQQLAAEVNRLKLHANDLQEEALGGRRLKALLKFKEETKSETLVAQVIGSSASETSRVLFIDRGSESGVRKNMPVITPDGIVGKVNRVFHGSSQVLVITDPEGGAGVLLADSRIQGSLRGVGGYTCKLMYIVNDEKVEPGDRVFTSGGDMIYPKGLPVGVVTSAKPGPVWKDVIVQPAARLNRLEEVMVVMRGVDEEIPAKPEPVQVAEQPPAEPSALPGPLGRPGSMVTAHAGGPATAVETLPRRPKESRATPVITDRGDTEVDRLMQAYRDKVAAGAAKKAPAPGTAVPGTPPATGATAPAAPAAGGAQPGAVPGAAAKKAATPGGAPGTPQADGSPAVPVAAAGTQPPGAAKKAATPGGTPGAVPANGSPAPPPAAKKTRADPNAPPAGKKNPAADPAGNPEQEGVR